MSPDATGFVFQRLLFRRLLYEVVDQAAREESETRPPSLTIGLQISTAVDVNEKLKRAVTSMEIKVLPDLKWQPYRIELNIAGIFAAADGTTLEQLAGFCQVNAPAILFPYAREAVHRLTMDAPHGPVRLNPVNISAMVNEGPWTVTDKRPNASTEPLQPSSR